MTRKLTIAALALLTALASGLVVSCVYDDAESDAGRSVAVAEQRDAADDPGDDAKAGNMVKLLAPDAQAEDTFGAAVAIDGDYAIAGAPYEDEGGELAGAAYVYRRTNANTWDAGIKLAASDADMQFYFGGSVAISGIYAIVGAIGEGGDESGAAYIFRRIDTDVWDVGTKLKAPDAEAGDLFGEAVAVSGKYAIIGASGEDEQGDVAGAAYIFHQVGDHSWGQAVKIVAPDAEAEDLFGLSVAIHGDYAVVGAPGEGLGGSLSGAAYVFRRTGENTWDSGTKLVPPDLQGGDAFGGAVAICGDHIVVGADNQDQGSNNNAGAAYVFHRTGENAWDAGTKLVASDAQVEDEFGQSVSISGDYVIVGAGKANSIGTDAGAAYLFHRTAENAWDAGTKILAPDGTANDKFGWSVSVSGEHALIGAVGQDEGGSGAGAAYVLNFECVSNAECDDGLWCDGAETCRADLLCQDGTPPCDEQTQSCDEENDRCDEIDDDDSGDDDDDDDDSGCCG